MRMGLNKIMLTKAIRRVSQGEAIAAVCDELNVSTEYLQQFIDPPKAKPKRRKKVATPDEGAEQDDAPAPDWE